MKEGIQRMKPKTKDSGDSKKDINLLYFNQDEVKTINKKKIMLQWLCLGWIFGITCMGKMWLDYHITAGWVIFSVFIWCHTYLFFEEFTK